MWCRILELSCVNHRNKSRSLLCYSKTPITTVPTKGILIMLTSTLGETFALALEFFNSFQSYVRLFSFHWNNTFFPLSSSLRQRLKYYNDCNNSVQGSIYLRAELSNQGPITESVQIITTIRQTPDQNKQTNKCRAGTVYRGLTKLNLVGKYVSLPCEGRNFSFTNIEYHIISSAPTSYRIDIRLKQIRYAGELMARRFYIICKK